MVSRVLKYKLGPVFFLCALLVGITAGGPMAQAEQVGVTISGDVTEDDIGIVGATVGVYDVDNLAKAEVLTGQNGEFLLEFDVEIGETEDAVWLYPGVQKDDPADYVITYGPFAAISKSDDPVNITDVELSLFTKALVAGIIAEVNTEAGAEDVDPNLGLVAGVVEIEIDDPQGGDDIVSLAGATITWTDLDGGTVNAELIYFGEDPEEAGEPGAPDSSLTATSGCGAFLIYNIVLDGDDEQDLIVTATKSGYTIPPVRVRAFPYSDNKITFASFTGAEGEAAPAGDGGGGGGGCFISTAER